MDITTETPVVAAPSDESAALQVLKEKLIDPHLPLIDQAEALQAHWTSYPQSPDDLGKKLDKSRSWAMQMSSFAKLPVDLKNTARSSNAGYRALRALLTSTPAGINAGTSGIKQSPPSGISGTSGISGITHGNSGISKSPASPNGYPLIRKSATVGVQLLRVWAWKPTLADEFGELVEAYLIQLTTGWRRIVLAALVIGFSGYGVWEFGHNVRPPVAHAWYLLTHPSAAGSGGSVQTLLSTPPVPDVTGRWIAGHLLELRWTPAEANDTYRVYWRSADHTLEHTVGGALKTAGAVVSVADVWGKGVVLVRSIRPTGEESQPSNFVEFDPEPINAQDSVEPLPMEGMTAATGNGQEAMGMNVATGMRQGATVASSRLPHADVGLHPPSEIHAIVRTPDLIRLTWRAVGPGVHYNVYSSASSMLSSLRKENDHPLKSNAVDWTPETGLERYWIVVTALDAQNHESAYSEAIEVVRHPEKSGSNAALDAASNAAAGTVRKLLPW